MKHKHLCLALLSALVLLTGCVARTPRLQTARPAQPASAVAAVHDTTWQLSGALPEEGESEFEYEYAERASIAGAAEYWRLIYQDEYGHIPGDGLWRAQQQMQAMREAQPVSAAGAGLSRAVWTELGPGNVGGSINALAFHPDFANNGKMWAGSAGGGIWQSLDSGLSWRPVQDFLADMRIGALVLDPANPDVIYAGIGYVDPGPGRGVFKSSDGGNTWQLLEETMNKFAGHVNALTISTDGQVLLCANMDGGLWRSGDGGTTWQQAGEPVTGTVWDVEFDPTDNNRALASSTAGRIWYSEDGGVNWQESTGLPAGAKTIELDYAANKPEIVYASVDRGVKDVNAQTLWKSLNGGKTFQAAGAQTNHLCGYGDCYDQAWLNNEVWVDPSNANGDVVVVGGIDLYRSTDGGQTLVNISKDRVHTDQMVIAAPPNFDGTNHKTLYVGNHGGIYHTSDVYRVQSDGWNQINQNLGVTQFYGIAVTSEGVVFGGAQDNGTIRNYGGFNTWKNYAGGDGGMAVAHPTNPQILFGEYQEGKVHRSLDGGESREVILGTTNKMADANGKTLFIAPLVGDPNVADRLFIGGQSLWRTHNASNPNDQGGPDWFAIKDPLPGAEKISAIVVAPDRPSRIFVGYENGEIYMTDSGDAEPDVVKASWSKVSTDRTPQRMVLGLTVHPHERDTLFATYGGFAAQNVWKGFLLGGLWTWGYKSGEGDTALPAVPYYSLAVNPDPAKASWLYLGGEVGIFTSEDGGNTWFSPHDGPTNTPARQLVWTNAETLYVGTFGRGVYKAKLGQVPVDCFSLSLVIAPEGTGNVVATPPNCADGKYRAGTEVRLEASGKAGYAWQSWQGATGDRPLARVTMDADKEVTATFAEHCFTLSVAIHTPDGSTANHQITRAPEPDCNNGTQYRANTLVFLSAETDPQSTTESFTGWTGARQVEDTQAVVLMDTDQQMTANFATVANNDPWWLAEPLVDLGLRTVTASGESAGAATTLHTFLLDTSNATADASDPLNCEADMARASVWFKYTPTEDGIMQLDTDGSFYDTVIMVFTGEDLAYFETVECDDDTEDEETDRANDLADFFADYDDVYSDEELYGGWFDEDFDPDYTAEDNLADVNFEYDDYFEVSEDEYAALQVPVTAGETYYVMVADVSDPVPSQQAESDRATTLVTPPPGGLLLLRATLVPQETYALTINLSGQGAVEEVEPISPYASGELALVIATPNDGWIFSGWSGDVSVSEQFENPLLMVMESNRTITANFVEKPANTFALSTSRDGLGSITVNPPGPYTAGQQVTLNAAPAQGWLFSGWSGAASGATNPLTLVMDSDKQISASFVRGAETTFALTTNVVGQGTVAANPQGSYTSGQLVTLTATPAAGWVFSGWSGAASGTANPLVVIMNGNKQITATFVQQTGTTFTLTTGVVGQGTVTANPQGPYASGQQATLTAVPAQGWVFSGWSGDATGTVNPLTVPMNGNKNITATFVQQTATTFALTTSVVGQGTITANPQGPYASGQLVTLTATPAAGWVFSGWSGAASGAANPLTVTMDGNKNITATFTEQQTTPPHNLYLPQVNR